MTIDVAALAQQLADDPEQRATLRDALLDEDGKNSPLPKPTPKPDSTTSSAS